MRDIDNSVLNHDLAVQLTPIDHARFMDYLHATALSVIARFNSSGSLADIDRAISILRIVIDGTPNGHHYWSERLNNLAESLMSRFERTEDVADLSETISAQQKVVHMTHDSNVHMPALLVKLGFSFRRRFQCTGDVRDISEAISVRRAAVHLTPEYHPHMPTRLNNLALSFQQRFESTGDIADISEAITGLQKAVLLTPEGHPNLPMLLISVSLAYQARYDSTEDLADVSEAISAQQKAIYLTPQGHPDLPIRLDNLGNSFQARFTYAGNLTDISNSITVRQKAVSLTPKGHSDIPMLLTHLGISFTCRFGRTGDPTDISKAISYHQKVIHLTPEGHAEMHGRLSNLGNAFSRRYEHTADLADISEAISAHQKSVHLIPKGHAKSPGVLNNLGNSLTCRFRRTGDLNDISEAISYLQEAVVLTPEGHVEMSTWLDNLATAFSYRFKHTGDVNDISEAISGYQKAVHLTPEGRANRRTYLGNLGLSFLIRYRHTGDIPDIFAAISTQQTAVDLTPEGHADMPTSLNNLGRSLLRRFESTDDPTDVSKAIAAHKKAVDLTPEGHANMPALLTNLGDSVLHRFKQTGDLTDVHTAISNYRLAASCSSGPPSERLHAAQNWATCSKAFDSSQTLDAYSLAIQLVSQVAGLEQTIQKRHMSLAEISDISTAAAATAFACGRYEMALEWLEQGRCLVWNQLNDLRNPLDDLRAHDPRMANELMRISKALEISGSRTDPPSLGEGKSMVQKISLQQAASTHVKLAQERDQLLTRIRSIPKFNAFLRPPQAANLLQHLPTTGPVIVINVHEDRCDALALLSGNDAPLHIPLENLTYKQADGLRIKLRSYISSLDVRAREVSNRAGMPYSVNRRAGSVMQDVLGELWECVVQPILNSLGFSHPASDLPRVWWCATGPLAFLPIHAAGKYGLHDKMPGLCVSDFMISSYTPTVATLIERVKKDQNTDLKNSKKVLMISQPNTPNLPPIPGTTTEIEVIRERLSKVNIPFLCLEDSAASLTAVMANIDSHSFIHLACHAVQDLSEPLKSGFYLHDGRLELSAILRKQLPHAGFAFLSACQTSTGDEKLSEEAVHLAAGMLAAGYEGVVATMWSIRDQYGPMVAEFFYDDLLTQAGLEEGQTLNSAGAAHALHYATERVRGGLGDLESALLTWVPYVHFGL
ncbi:CHAT domain-containing protein [Crassisporium funariophilum]|nr:CHAT domain-containing protein [Crassisporium funariophilum]